MYSSSPLVSSFVRRFSSTSSSVSFSSFQLLNFPAFSNPSSREPPLSSVLPSHTAVTNSSALPTPRSHELLVRYHSVALNPLDLFYLRGYGRSLVPLLTTLPLTLGRDGSAEIIKVGSGIMDMKVGDKVWISRNPLHSGTFTDYSTVDRRECSLKPVNLSVAHAAAYPFALTTAWSALVTAGFLTPKKIEKPWENPIKIPPIEPLIKSKLVQSVRLTKAEEEMAKQWNNQTNKSNLPGIGLNALIHGAGGPVGLTALQLLISWGWSVSVTCKGQRQADLITKCIQNNKQNKLRGSLIEIIDSSKQYSNQDSGASSDQFSYSDAFPSPAFDFILDGVGGEEAAQLGLRALKPGGKFITLRGNLIRLCDENGVCKGISAAAVDFVHQNQKFVQRESFYLWGINQPSVEALEYGKLMVERGELEIPIDHTSENRFHGVESIPDALVYYDEQRPAGKVVVSLT
jgi:NADPH:quinone reductase-like Zn-dependent oxidoreductase